MDLRLERDRIIENFYNLVWQKQIKDQDYRDFFLPDTILYKHQQPRAWCFSNKEGCIKKNLKKNSMLNQLQKPFSPGFQNQ
ncbi:hypothetical protein SteCoe_39189 [Stentor coeruleus]|uniref:Uncharacterized protein n=1 Tax=Stentor coeruleus TaxID=5963 RepID=A0A1R2AKT0_9CILI|nr:hypothetical protein SteCoe_39189 [Stentor coeruleus]